MPLNNLLEPLQYDIAPETTTDIYEVPEKRGAIVTVQICNRDSQNTRFRLYRAVGGEATAVKQAYYYNTKLPANDSLTFQITLTSEDVVRIWTDIGSQVSVTVNPDESQVLSDEYLR